MYSKFDEVSLVGMPDNAQLLLSEKDHPEMIEIELLLRPNCKLEFPERSDDDEDDDDDDDDELHHQQQEDHEGHDFEEEDQEEEEEEEKECKAIVSSDQEPMMIKPSLGEFEVEDNDEDDDGFRTPTSLEHKIPVTGHCPPAPRKPKSLPSTKRKASSSKLLHHVRIDLSDDIELLFPPAVIADLGRKIKKVRGDDNK